MTHRLALLAFAFLLASCASDRALREGQALISEGRYEEGLARLDEAAASSEAIAPGSPVTMPAPPRLTSACWA